MAPLPMLLLALLAAAAEPAAPAPAAQAEEALIDRFMAALPDAQQLQQENRGADQAELARLARLNPGKEDAIRPVLEAFAACETPISNAMGRSGLRFLAQRLGSAKLERLIRFYEGEDVRRLTALAPRLEAGEALEPEEQAELDRILADYPLAEFNALMTADLPGFFAAQTEQLAAIDRCNTEKEAALARLDVDTVGPILTPVPPSPVPNAGQ